jgi:spore germination cell wall hydrolase CwlJ-like protein
MYFKKLLAASIVIAVTPVHAMWTESKEENAKNIDITHCFVSKISLQKCINDTSNRKKVVVNRSKSSTRIISDNDVQPGFKPIDGQSDKDVACLAYSIFREAGNQDTQNQYAVGQVHINRLKQGSWGNSMCKVVYSKAQFSWTLESKIVRWSSKQQAHFMMIAKGMIHDGLRVKPLASTKILHYHATYVSPRWGKKDSLVAKAGDHVFYKGIK